VAAVYGNAGIGKLVSLIRLLTPPPKINESTKCRKLGLPRQKDLQSPSKLGKVPYFDFG